MLQILFGSLVLSLMHASIPNHWLPLVAVGRAQRWTRGRALLVTGITGIAHASSTILIGIVVGLLGYTISGDSMLTSVVPVAVLLGLGVMYLFLDRRHAKQHNGRTSSRDSSNKASTFSLVASLSAAMFFSPCIEIEVYYLQGGFFGWPGILTISVVYLVVTVLGMLFLVDLGLAGARRIRSHYLERHEKQVTGLVLIALGLVALLAAL